MRGALLSAFHLMLAVAGGAASGQVAGPRADGFSFRPAASYDGCVEALVGLYSEWNESAPGRGHDAAARRWQAKLPASQPATAPAKP